MRQGSLWALRMGLKVGALGGVIIALLFLTLWIEHNQPLELSAPTGPFRVGRLSATWSDTARTETFSTEPGQPRELAIWLWYPVDPSSDEARTADYLPEPRRSALKQHRGVVLSQFLLRDPAKITGHSMEGSGLAETADELPVILFNSGIGALAHQYSTLVEELASQGYVVVGMDRPYSTSVVVVSGDRVVRATPRGNPGDGRIPGQEVDAALDRLLGVWVADVRFVLNQLERMNRGEVLEGFTGRLTLTSVGLAGHSFGGATALEACRQDSRCGAGINLDGALHGPAAQEGAGQPFFFLLSDRGSSLSPADAQIFDQIRSVAARAPADNLIATLQGAHHFSFSDQAITQSRIVRSVLARLGGAGQLAGREGLQSTSRLITEFFDIHLRGQPRGPLYSGAPRDGLTFEAHEN